MRHTRVRALAVFGIEAAIVRLPAAPHNTVIVACRTRTAS